MDLRRFLDLYIAETQEHLRTLGRTLLELESGSTDAVAEAFRSAHTIKGLSAAMGYVDVAQLAHRLEDTLDQVRNGSLKPDAVLIDRLLRQADELDHAVTNAVANVTPQLDGGTTSPAAAAASRPTAELPPDVILPAGTSRIGVVRLREDAPIKSARALLIIRSLADVTGYLGAHPHTFADDYDGVLHLFFAGADESAVEEMVRRAGDVESVMFHAADETRTVAKTAAELRSALRATRKARTVRVDENRLDGVQESLGELSILQNRLRTQGGARNGQAAVVDRMRTLLSELQLEVLTMRMVPLSETFARLPRVVRDAARAAGREVDFVMQGDEIELDRSILNELGDPLIHMLRNAVDHGIEPADERAAAGKPRRGQLVLRAERERNSVRVVLEDDGRGVNRARVVEKAIAAGLIPPGSATNPGDEEIFRLLSHPGFSTADEVTELSGRGVGLDAVVSKVRALGGAVEMHSLEGAGTTFMIRLPISLALAQALRVRVAGEDYAIPLTHLSEAIELSDNVQRDGDREQVRLRDGMLPLVRLRRMLQADTSVREGAAVIAEMGDRRAALAVDELVGREQILVKNFDPAVGTLPFFSGATLLDDGRPALVLDPLSVM
ncbi:MAG TPA: chemotaxis protein CheA [Longimicrobiales bacterium]